MFYRKISKFSISGLDCDSCVRDIKDLLSKVKGISRIYVNLMKKEATIIFNYNLLSSKTIIGFITLIGFKAKEIDSVELN
jgi:copper chaperone CopZ